MPAPTTGVLVVSTIVPQRGSSVPTHHYLYGAGGYRTFETINERSLFASHLRAEGMLCYVVADNSFYRLLADLTTWEAIPIGPSDRLYIQVESTAHGFAQWTAVYKSSTGVWTRSEATNFKKLTQGVVSLDDPDILEITYKGAIKTASHPFVNFENYYLTDGTSPEIPGVNLMKAMPTYDGGYRQCVLLARSDTEVYVEDQAVVVIGRSPPTSQIPAHTHQPSDIVGLTASTLLGRGEPTGGEAEEIILGAGLLMTGTTLSVTAVGDVDGGTYP
jgi:hypothetical protein